MVQQVIDEPLWRQSNKTGIYLHVIDYNVAAQRLYEKMGFAFYETLRQFYTLDGRQWDAYVYVYLFEDEKHEEVRGSPYKDR